MWVSLILLLAAAMLLFSIGGYWWEYLIGKRDRRYEHVPSGTSIPILPIYGLGAICLFLGFFVIKRYTNIESNLLIALGFGLVLTILECWGGRLFRSIAKRRAWDYSEIPCCACEGHINLFISIGWTLFVFCLLTFDPVFIPRVTDMALGGEGSTYV